MTGTPSALDVLLALLRCASVTPAEGGALDVIQSYLEPAGFAVHRPTFSEPGTPDVENLYARIGTGAPHLVFAGHTDVVPPGDEAAPSGRRRGPARRAVPIRTARSAWTGKQENLARIYHEQGIRPEEIARRLGLSQYQVTQLLLAVTSRRGR